MNYQEWEPEYLEICRDMGYDPAQDTMSARVLLAVTQNSDLRMGSDFEGLMKGTVTVLGGAGCLEKDIAERPPEGCIIAAGSAAGRAGITPDIMVTDLDGDLQAQIGLSAAGVPAFILAHGDNAETVARCAPLFKGPIVLTTQGEPFGIVECHGGFTDGDRAVCLAKEAGSQRILLRGFDFGSPMPKAGSDPAVKLRKLSWAKRIIEEHGGAAVRF
ncbi:DNA transporter [Candidatus Methanomethylophilus sp. 1R26]|jgi:uncharacterized Rossmann fold enzyme|uniref:6-hydroxymethylpterin diphosphokinase MptE-like protein n=1 Tax=Candidatus Methanomethylophilus sp. 1R26 TaxID=1769296 RepID=UPI0007371DCC|nr:6-hydroxymethylpterin diphosphokinase MptE-like protein [Candidatus Methanomethylophilus sp. 1R26]KUE73631.1 DNA transporter [Candidatus Methanomethylophilus sp. 1R26]MCH3978638.1 DUF115 domain-containing protein [Methanomethylophilus sp.]MCI2074221.1 DUF115 domain-containing protein [Methanomethylophilus sp.]MCI2092982.1 DUF115 domain-containing protein [Methanomethylophilus sp.]